MPDTVCGAVLAGGASRRFGSDKANFEVAGLTMLERSVEALRGAGCAPVYVVGGDQEQRQIPETTHLADTWPNEGPLGAIVTALQTITCGWLVVLSCDVPAVRSETIKRLLLARSDLAEVVVARSESGLEPLVAIYSFSVSEQLEEAFLAGARSVASVLRTVSTIEVSISNEQLLNVNRPEDLGSW